MTRSLRHDAQTAVSLSPSSGQDLMKKDGIVTGARNMLTTRLRVHRSRIIMRELRL